MAVTLTAQELATASGLDLDISTRILPVWSAVIEAEAPDAPEVIQNEATVRACTYYQALTPTQSSGVGFGPIQVDTIFNARQGQAAVMRNSAARELLAPWRSHTAVTAKGST